MVGAHPLAPFFELLDDLIGGADRDEERFVDVVEIERAVQLVGKRRAFLQFVDGQIAGRRQECRRGAQRVFEEKADVLDRFLLGLFLGLRDIGDDLQRKLLRPDLVAVFGREPAQVLIELERALLGDEHRRVAKAELGREIDGFRASGADDVAGRMRLLIRPRPRIEVAVGVEIAVIGGRAVLRPGLQDDVDRLAMALARGRRIDRIGPVFHAGAERKRDLEASLRHHVEHGVFFRQPVRIFEIGRRAPNADFGVLDLRNDRRGDQVRRRHHAVGGVVMLVDDDRVEADLVGQHELGKIALVERMAAFWSRNICSGSRPRSIDILCDFPADARTA